MCTMSEQYGILLVSHVAELADGLTRLLKQVAKDVTVNAVGGAEGGGNGTRVGKVIEVHNEMEEPELFAFYDRGLFLIHL